MSGSTTNRSATDLITMKQGGTRIVVSTAYDNLTGRLADRAGVDAVIVGDSVAMVVQGGDTILSSTIDEMVLFARAAGSGAHRPVVIADLPFGTYEQSDDQAVDAATRLIKEGGAQAVKLEGGGTSIERAKAITDAGIAVMAHLVPTGPLWVSDRWRWSQSELARRTFDDAIAYERAGCFGVMLECVPAAVATAISAALTVPTIGFGSGPGCDGQVLSTYDLLGLTDGELSPYSKQYVDLTSIGLDAFEQYAGDVREGRFPLDGQAEPISDEEQRRFAAGLATSEEKS